MQAPSLHTGSTGFSASSNSLRHTAKRPTPFLSRQVVPKGVLVKAAATVQKSNSPVQDTTRVVDVNQRAREGDYEASLVQKQAEKQDPEQPSVADTLQRFDPESTTAEVTVVGCGPAGLALAAELAKKGVSVVLVGLDKPFVNNYGVWVDEFRELGLADTLDAVWDDAICYFGEGQPTYTGRAYGRVCRRRLRKQLLAKCQQAGVLFLDAEVSDVKVDESGQRTILTTSKGTVTTRLSVMAAGAAAGKFLKFEDNAPSVAAQTAYGIEAEVEGYEKMYDPKVMLFMDFRRHHTGLFEDTAHKLRPGNHPNAGEGMWGTQTEVPSFLYAMPLQPGLVFLEETCLVTKPALPFNVLKRRLERRLAACGIKVKRVIEEEWSYIPVGGPLPLDDQPITAFGAAANLVHPATGYSITRSLREAPEFADKLAFILRKNESVSQSAKEAWSALWPPEKRRQAAFHVFGMELLAALDLAATNSFFHTFFKLPSYYWRGFLASTLGSGQLIIFALFTFALAPIDIKVKLVSHLMTDPAGRYLVSAYTASLKEEDATATEAVAAAIAFVVVSSSQSPLMWLLTQHLLHPMEA